jgi:AcrR family transcriptional regulator
VTATPGHATRERILDATSQLFRLRGYSGTAMKQVVAAAGAPFGSVYHFFPGGKEQLGIEAIERAGKHYEDIVLLVFDAEPDSVGGTRAVFAGAADVLRESGYEDACPIATVALEVASTNDSLREATARVFESWVVTLAGRLVAAGAEPVTARATAMAVIELLEGAFVLCRAARATAAMDAAGAAAVALVTAALPST